MNELKNLRSFRYENDARNRDLQIAERSIDAIKETIELEHSYLAMRNMKILVVGATGIGKSSLINDILWPDDIFNPKDSGNRKFPLETGLMSRISLLAHPFLQFLSYFHFYM